ncbi:MAG: hypothetical protein LC624_04620 [Halobacteriales archaeon]|nr:hypothetical protein [Halobacteriales archaeon]
MMVRRVWLLALLLLTLIVSGCASPPPGPRFTASPSVAYFTSGHYYVEAHGNVSSPVDAKGVSVEFSLRDTCEGRSRANGVVSLGDVAANATRAVSHALQADSPDLGKPMLYYFVRMQGSAQPVETDRGCAPLLEKAR